MASECKPSVETVSKFKFSNLFHTIFFYTLPLLIQSTRTGRVAFSLEDGHKTTTPKQ